jgi:hypothetical protein
MKKLIFIFLILVSGNLKAQFFNNSNNELCIKLYERSDAAGSYMVYLVLEDLEEHDMKMLDNWDSLDQVTKTRVTQRWAIEGKRVEAIRAPYIMNPPVFPKDLKKPVLKPLPPARPAKDFWGGKFPVEI